MPRFRLLLSLAIGVSLLTSLTDLEPISAQSSPDFSVLVFSKTEGYRHASIEDGIAALTALADTHGFKVTATEDASVFTSSNLAAYDAVVFLNTTQDIFDESQQAAFEAYIQGGGGFMGIHAAADTEYDWPWYGELVGAYFESHPETQPADVLVLDPAHPATEHLPARWTRTDEWYNYNINPRGKVHVLATVSEKSYEGGKMGDDHPIVWAHEYDGGRAFYTGLGHTPESYRDPLFLQHLLGGLRWTAGVEEADIGATLTGSFEAVVLDTNTTYPMELEVAPDGRVFWIERTGAVKIWDPETESTHEAAYLPVTDKIEDGLLGIALDPEFEDNQWVYLYYTPISEDPNRLSRFTMHGNDLDLSSEIIMLEVKMQRERCCHSAGGLVFGPDGNLFLSTGDNTGGSAPRTDERPGREHFDAQRTTANTNDLRGKILRITPQPDGSYTIPEGNLFEDDDPLTRPEIYTMGHRNPWRIAIDPKRGWVYWGDVGPGNPYMEGQMPQGHEEFGQAQAPGFFGWPYFVGPNGPYRDFNFETEEFGDWPDPEAPVNDSPNNTGLQNLPPAQPAWIWYSYVPSEEFPEMGVGGMSAGAGPVYAYDPETVGPHGLPAYYDGKVIIFEFMRNWIQEVTVDEDGTPLEITRFTPEIPYIRPIDVTTGPDGRLYVLEWGTEFWGQARNAQLVRLDYYGSSQRPPEVTVKAEPTSGPAPLQVSFEASDSLDYAWDFDGDGTPDDQTATPTHTYTDPGSYTAHLTVTDAEGLTTTQEIDITVGNTAPEVSIAWPLHGGFFDFNAPIPYAIDVTDHEDGPITSPGQGVTVHPALVHDTHPHALHMHRGRTGTFNVMPDPSHKPYIIDHYVTLKAEYTDAGAPETEALTSSDQILLRPRVVEAENFTTERGTSLITTGSRQRPNFAEVTEIFIEVGNEDFISLDPVNLYGIEALSLRMVPEDSGSVEIRLDALDGPLLAEATLVPAPEPESPPSDPPSPPTLEEENDQAMNDDTPPKITGWTDLVLPIEDPGSVHTLYFVFRGPQRGTVAKFDSITFEGTGIMIRPEPEVSTTP